MSVNDNSSNVIVDYRVMLQIVPSITDDSRAVIYNHNMFNSTGNTLSVRKKKKFYNIDTRME
jgi:hypothetical protein